MFATGLIDDGSSNVPTRTTVRPARPVESAKRWHPQFGQKRRRTVLPLSPWLLYSASVPEISMFGVGKIAFAVPFPAIC